MAFVPNAVLLGVVLSALYYLRVWLDCNAFAPQHGCQLPPRRPTSDPILGIFYKLQDSRSAKVFKSLSLGLELYRKYGATYRESTLFATTIKTSSAENIQTIFGSKANDYGIQPFRLAGMRPFCGGGLLTTDGPIWERSRTMIKPTFHKSNISDLGTFERSVGRLISYIPVDGSTIDLQPLIVPMVRATSYTGMHN